MEKNELQKELMKNKVEAEFSHYCAGNLYYKVVTNDGIYQFPISTTEIVGNNYPMLQLSSDLGTTAFNSKERASMLWRWIDKAIDKGEYIKV